MGKYVSVLAIFVSVSAQAAVYSVGLGQNATLQTGDVAVVQYGSISTAITCNGSPVPPPLPATQVIDGRRNALFTSIFQNSDDASRSIECSQYSGDANIQQAVTDAENQALETCTNMGYASCQAYGDTSQNYSFTTYGAAVGQYGCSVVAHVLGSN